MPGTGHERRLSGGEALAEAVLSLPIWRSLNLPSRSWWRARCGGRSLKQ